MLLGELVAAYRKEHDLSQRGFAAKSGLTNGYISMIESGVNPKTGKPITPSFDYLSKLAAAMDMSVHTLIAEIEDMPVDISADKNTKRFTDGALWIASKYDQLNDAGKQLISQTIEFALQHHSK